MREARCAPWLCAAPALRPFFFFFPSAPPLLARVGWLAPRPTRSEAHSGLTARTSGRSSTRSASSSVVLWESSASSAGGRRSLRRGGRTPLPRPSSPAMGYATFLLVLSYCFLFFLLIHLVLQYFPDEDQLRSLAATVHRRLREPHDDSCADDYISVVQGAVRNARAYVSRNVRLAIHALSPQAADGDGGKTKPVRPCLFFCLPGVVWLLTLSSFPPCHLS